MTRVDTAAARESALRAIADGAETPTEYESAYDKLYIAGLGREMLALAADLDAARAALPSAVWLEWIADSFVGVTHPNAADMRAAIRAAAATIRALDAPPATVAGAGE